MARTLVGRRILVIDEHPRDAVLISNTLRHAGAIVSLASSPVEALGLLGCCDWELAVVSVSLNGRDCNEFCTRLLKADVPFLITAHDVSVRGSASWGLRIRRPIVVEELIRAAEQLLKEVAMQSR